MNDELENSWYPYEKGETVGRIGFEGGIILRDEEFGDPTDSEAADARLTIERGSIGLESRLLTVNLYGWLQASRVFDNDDEATDTFEELKIALPTIAQLVPNEDDRNIAIKVAVLNDRIADLQARFTLYEEI